MDFGPLVSKKQDRFRELEVLVAAPDLYNDPKRAREILREHTRLKELLALWDALLKTRTELSAAQELATGTDAEMAEMAQAELPELETRLSTLEKDVQLALLPPDPNEDRDAIVEIRAGTGGDEAALFAAPAPSDALNKKFLGRPPITNSPLEDAPLIYDEREVKQVPSPCCSLK